MAKTFKWIKQYYSIVQTNSTLTCMGGKLSKNLDFYYSQVKTWLVCEWYKHQLQSTTELGNVQNQEKMSKHLKIH